MCAELSPGRFKADVEDCLVGHLPGTEVGPEPDATELPGASTAELEKT